MEGYITTEQAAPLIGKSERTVRRYIKEGKLEGFKDEDGHYLVSIISISRYLASNAPAEDGVILMKILSAIYESARTGNEVKIDC